MKQPKLINIIIISLFYLTFFFWLLSDMIQLLPTPLSQFGMNHWVPELALVFTVGYSVVDNKKISSPERDIITIILFLYPLTYYSLTFQTIPTITFGFGVGCIFSGFFLAGIWFADHRHKTKTFNKVIDIIIKEGQI